MHIKNDPIVFTWDDIDKYLNENIRCNYLLETEYQGVQYAVFYHPLPLREYRGAYWTEDQYKWKDVPAVVEAGWIEEIKIDGVIADNQDVIFSRQLNSNGITRPRFASHLPRGRSQVDFFR